MKLLSIELVLLAILFFASGNVAIAAKRGTKNRNDRNAKTYCDHSCTSYYCNVNGTVHHVNSTEYLTGNSVCELCKSDMDCNPTKKTASNYCGNTGACCNYYCSDQGLELTSGVVAVLISLGVIIFCVFPVIMCVGHYYRKKQQEQQTTQAEEAAVE